MPAAEQAPVPAVQPPPVAQTTPQTPPAAQIPPPAQPVPPAGKTISLTLEQAVATAMSCHPDVISAQAAAVRAQAAAVQERALRWPQLTLELNATAAKGLERTVETGGEPIITAGDVNYIRNADVALTYTIFQSGLSEQIRQAETLAAAQLLGIPDAQRLLGYQVTQTYYNILAQKQVTRALLQSLAASERHREEVQARIDAGTAPRSDLLPVEVEVAQARLLSVQAETNLETSIAALKALLLIPPQDQVELADLLPESLSVPGLNDLLCLAETNRPDIAAQKLNIRAAELGTDVAKTQAGVQFFADATANYGRHTGETGEQWTLQAGASYPLFDAGSSKAGVTSAQAAEVQAQERLASLRLNMQRDVESALLALNQSKVATEVAAVGTASAESSMAAAEARYREGLAIILEVTDAQVQLLQAQVAEIQARYNQTLALAQLRYATGAEIPTPNGENK
ncbi:MAG: TolC family protein [Bacteroidota bacterium]